MNSTRTLPNLFRISLLCSIFNAVAFVNAVFGQPTEPLLAQPREARFAQLVAALEEVAISEKSSFKNTTPEGFLHRKNSEIHIDFLSAVSGRDNDDQDGLIEFPLQVGGIFQEFNSRAADPPEIRSGSDFQTVTITLANLFQESATPKAKIDIPALRHGSDFDAVQLARDKIIELLEWYLPECRIEGVRKFYEKKIVVQNDTRENVVVWIQYLNRRRNDAGYEWVWQPAAAGSKTAVQRLVAPGRTEVVLDANEVDLQGNCMRIWAEGDSGRRWNRHQSTDLWLVPRNEKMNGERAYHAEEMKSYVYHIEGKPGPRVFTERLLSFRNDTSEKLTVQMRYCCTSQGAQSWRSPAPFVLQPGQTLSPQREDGLRVRASRVQVLAVGDTLHFGTDAKTPRWLVDETNGLRAYRALSMGGYVYSFQANLAGE